MLRRLSFWVTVFLALVVTASAAEHLQVHTLPIPGRGILVISSPIAWSKQISQPPEAIAPTIRFSSAAGQKFEVVITAFWSPTNDSSFNSASNVRSLVDDTLGDLNSRLVESDIPILELYSGSGTGYYFSATDKAPDPNEYKFLTQGAIAADDLLLTFTVLTKEKLSPIINTTLNMLRSSRRGT
jgi:hypothetical protein